MAEHVVLLHGILIGSVINQPLADQLAALGYQVNNINYPSTAYTIENLTEIIYRQIKPLLEQSEVVHFVGFSMGGLITRFLLQQYRPQQLGKVVLVATPNYGTPLVDFLKEFRIYQRYYGLSGLQLGTDEKGFFHQLKSIDYPVAGIAGNKPCWKDLLFARFIVPRPNDGKVPVSSAIIPEMQNSIVLPAPHPMMMQKQIVIDQVIHYLKNGVFKEM